MTLYIISESIRRVEPGGATYGWAIRHVSEHRRKADAIAEADALDGSACVWRQHDNAVIHRNDKRPRDVDMNDRRYWGMIQ